MIMTTGIPEDNLIAGPEGPVPLWSLIDRPEPVILTDANTSKLTYRRVSARRVFGKGRVVELEMRQSGGRELRMVMFPGTEVMTEDGMVRVCDLDPGTRLVNSRTVVLGVADLFLGARFAVLNGADDMLCIVNDIYMRVT